MGDCFLNQNGEHCCRVDAIVRGSLFAQTGDLEAISVGGSALLSLGGGGGVAPSPPSLTLEQRLAALAAEEEVTGICHQTDFFTGGPPQECGINGLSEGPVSRRQCYDEFRGSFLGAENNVCDPFVICFPTARRCHPDEQYFVTSKEACETYSLEDGSYLDVSGMFLQWSPM